MHSKMCLGGKYIPRLLFCFKVNRPPPSIYTQKNTFGEHLLPKPIVSVFAYILTTDKVIIAKLHRNIKQMKYYIMLYKDKRGVA